MDPDSPSFSRPPSIAPDSLPVNRLQRNPVFEVAAGRRAPAAPGRGRGRGRGRGASSSRGGGASDESTTRFERISLLAVELQQGAEQEDGDEYPDSDTDRVSAIHAAVDNADEEEDREYDDEGGDADSEDGFRRPKEPVRKPQSIPNMMARAAFSTHRPQKKDDVSDTESSVSRTSSKRKRDAYKEAMPKGIHCVGCAIPHRIGPVERCVNQNIGRVSDHALWRLAELAYEKDVVAPAKREGITTLPWSHGAIRNHFVLHCTNSQVGRTSMIQSLSAMRYQLEGKLIRVEGEERELDKQNAELTLKVLAAESRERQLLAAGASGGRGRGGAVTAVTTE